MNRRHERQETGDDYDGQRRAIVHAHAVVTGPEDSVEKQHDDWPEADGGDGRVKPAEITGVNVTIDH